jgi:rhombotail lipoprotein
MFDVDVVALISYDQAQFSSDTKKSFVYWTILGAYVVEGEKNDTRTMLDAVVYDIRSRKLLFRAPGTSVVKGASSAADRQLELARDRKKGFDDASHELTGNLDRQLQFFTQRVKDRPEEIKVIATQEYRDRARVKGAGSVDFMTALAIVLLGLTRVGGSRVSAFRRTSR